MRLSDDVGRVIGAGMMLDEWHLLTCAHVVEAVGGRYGKPVVDFVGIPQARSGVASVVEDGWVPVTEDERGDIALLRLESPERRVCGAPLRRMLLRDDQLVRAYGFPEGAEAGMWTLARLVGEGGPGAEWVQLHRTPDAEPIEGGYSGTAVLDEATGYVVGMVVGRYTGDGGRVGWMIPVETMEGHLSLLKPWIQGSPGVDDSFADARTDVVDVPFARAVADWLTRSGAGAVWEVVTGEPESAAAGALRLMVLMADRERSTRLPRMPDGVGDLPRIGSVDLAVDASGKTAEEVRLRIDERLGLTDGAAWGRTVVVDGIDDAAEPERLVREVLDPLADRAGELGIRLMLVFRRRSPRQGSGVRASPESGVPAGGGGVERLEVLERAVAELAAIEEHQLALAPRFDGVAVLPGRARRLRGLVRQLDAALTAGDTAWAERHIGECERAVSSAVEEGRRLRARLDDLLDRRAVLRARLDIYAEMASARGLVENSVLIRLYARAWDQLYQGPCELGAAWAAVDAYVDAVRGLGGGR
ncbi:hypothetical protein Actkin_02243 [Actinokineospora sp. UTMC 2448]|nr:hypothetical protein Actkin_02243 [Actinokineospora sp. UTMC 2448]